jgi:O-antigen ligase
LFGYALALTKSRGGFIAMLAGSLILLRARFGFWKTFPAVLVALPIMLFFFGGRQTAIDLTDKEDTAQGRIELWSEGMDLFREAPVFGIGQGEYADRVIHVAHNSFVHCFTELGLFGGTLFAGAFYLAIVPLRQLGAGRLQTLDPAAKRMRPYVLAIVVTYVVGMLSLSRAYIPPTYTVLGVASACLSFPGAYRPMPQPRLSGRLVATLVVVGVLTLTALYFFVRIAARG